MVLAGIVVYDVIVEAAIIKYIKTKSYFKSIEIKAPLSKRKMLRKKLKQYFSQKKQQQECVSCRRYNINTLHSILTTIYIHIQYTVLINTCARRKVYLEVRFILLAVQINFSFWRKLNINISLSLSRSPLRFDSVSSRFSQISYRTTHARTANITKHHRIVDKQYIICGFKFNNKTYVIKYT